MKNQIFLVLLVGFIAFSCKKKEIEIKPILTAQLNGKEWYSSRQSAVYNTNDSTLIHFLFEYVLPNEEESEALVFYSADPVVGRKVIINHRVQAYTKDTCASHFSTVVGGDVILEKYDVDETGAENFLLIDSYDKASGRVTGSFQVTYFNNDLYYSNWLPERLEFKEGRFDLVIDK
jgi:hypothetical protein